MPPIVASSLCIAFIIVSFIIDLKQKSHVSKALWIPWIWVMIAISKPVTLWLDPGAMASYEEGDTLDRNISAILMLAGIYILYRRNLNWSEIFRNNILILLFFLYCGISIMWSDIAFVSFKRWIRAIGALIMVLIILTEDNPAEAIRIVTIRCAYILIPLSILFIKYYPELGVSYGPWGGRNVGGFVCTSKNSLGRLCMICGLILVWRIAELRSSETRAGDKKKMLLDTIFLIMIAWIFLTCNSKTSLTSFMVAVCVFMGLGLPPVRRNLNHINIFMSLIFSFGLLLWLLTDIQESTVGALGRDMTFTGRTMLWKELLQFNTNFFWGVGYESFWSGDRLLNLFDKHWWKPNEAHNGYLEVYLDLGITGIILLLAVIVHTYKKVTRKVKLDFNYGRFQLAFFIAFLLYNVTEAAVQSWNIAWFFFLLIAVYFSNAPKVPAREQTPA